MAAPALTKEANSHNQHSALNTTIVVFNCQKQKFVRIASSLSSMDADADAPSALLHLFVKVLNIFRLTHIDVDDGEDRLGEEGCFQLEVLHRLNHAQESYGRQTGKFSALSAK